jgi:hypothetical protein
MTGSSPTEGIRSVADVATSNAGRFLQQLCKHFQHKRPVSYDARSGHIAFAIGECRLAADDGVLKLALVAPDASQLDQLQDIVARYLLRFAFREEMRINWRRV